MHWLGLIVAIVFLNSCFVLTINSAKSTTSLKTNDPCSKLKCNKTEVVCVEKTNNGKLKHFTIQFSPVIKFNKTNNILNFVVQ